MEEHVTSNQETQG